jgi:NTP pyrophosphatase (non-canonical NTP hydrolase)
MKKGVRTVESPVDGLTFRQRQLWDFIVFTIQTKLSPPTMREMGEHLGCKSTNGVNDILKRIERKGFIVRENTRSRGIAIPPEIRLKYGLLFSSSSDYDLRRLQREAYDTATEKGWHEEKLNLGEQICNMHSELSEAWEWYRKGIIGKDDNFVTSDHIPDFMGIEEEFADVIIRILDVAQSEDLDVTGAVLAKMKFNKTRPYRHGGKKV